MALAQFSKGTRTPKKDQEHLPWGMSVSPQLSQWSDGWVRLLKTEETWLFPEGASGGWGCCRHFR